MSDIILSICIPTYNRCESIVSNITQILCSQSEEFEIVVLDNKSEDGTYQTLLNITDERLKVFQNQENIGGILNPLKVICYASGKYSLLLLDKDSLCIERLDDFIQFLKTDTFSHGFCKLDIEQKFDINFIYRSGLDSLLNTAYLSRHPSGSFWKTDLYKNCKTLEKIFSDWHVFGFYVELINADLSVTNILPTAIYNNPLIYTEQEDRCNKILTKSYSKKNLFLLPKMRNSEYREYLKQSSSLRLSPIELSCVQKKIVRAFVSSVLNCIRLKKSEPILNHYGITGKDITLFDVFYNSANFILWYLFFCRGLSFLRRNQILMDILNEWNNR